MSADSGTLTAIRPAAGGVGTDADRPDGTLKVIGEFAYGSDLWMEGMVWGATLRSPHPAARIRSVDVAPALGLAGVHTTLTADDARRQALRTGDRRPAGAGHRCRALPGRAGGARGC